MNIVTETLDLFVGGNGKIWTIDLEVQDPATGLLSADDITGYTAVSVKLFVVSAKDTTGYTSTNAPAVISASPASVSWQPSATDVATPGNYQVQVLVTLPTGVVPYRGPLYTVSPY